MAIQKIIGSETGDVFDPVQFIDLYPAPVTAYVIELNGGDDNLTVSELIPTQVDAGAGNDTVTLSDAADAAFGGDGNDTISTGGGDDWIDGGADNDIISAGLGNDYILAGDGDDVVNAGNGDDSVFGGNGADILNGAGGNDYIDGGHGNDIIDGGSGDDFIFGRKGNNDLFGGAGNDTVNTGDHTSSADGGTGDDLIVARLKKGGDHTLTGGEGADTFEFVYQTSKKSSDLTITDFELGVDDMIIGGMAGQDWLSANLAFADAFGLDIVTEVDGNAVLEIGFNDSITFEGVSEAEFMAFYTSEPLIVA
ncbi:calcium-binding protein [Litoreibacter janthinus]|uniref:Hemolysin-type calcium-binding repeat-containing protein n=1 Tax=Litoreibacter janthinus TaxID=670154 RepID=A0A1I6FT95_9RHOB|nr:calcium-binding protein [Litoreibacter janthinus]SFR33172.1 Hemolysin-type calcium-binding repeat-containing protein [Litoreibacter janthinus]